MSGFRRIGVALALLAAVAATATVPLASADRGRGHHRSKQGGVGYFIKWGIYGRSYFVKNVETSGSADKLTVINYAFANVAPASPNDPGVVCPLAQPCAAYPAA